MTPDIIKLLLGFLVTTVLGGILGYYFQSRAWTHQNRVRLLEVEQTAATKLFDEISRLMDKRLYRMRQLHWKLKQKARRELIDEHMQRYRDVLYEWNDSLNRNLALTESYFHADIRKVLEGTVYEEFSRIGTTLEGRYRKASELASEPDWTQTAKDLAALSHHIYKLNVRMIRSIQDRQRELPRAGKRFNKVA